DGTIWNAQTLHANAVGIDASGAESDDFLTGTPVDDVLRGFGGNDYLDGRAGADLLLGGAGNDRYSFNIGDGIDKIDDSAMSGDSNLVQFGFGITQNSLAFTRDEAARMLTIRVGAGGSDQLRLLNFDPSGINGSLVVQTLRFTDGSIINLADLFPAVANHAPTVANPLANQTVQEDTPFSIQVPANTFADPDAGDTLTYSATQANDSALPTWLSFNATTRTFTGTPDDAQVGTLNLAVKATDSAGLSATSAFALTV